MARYHRHERWRRMLRNYLTTAWRGLRRHRSHTVVNVFGLALGMACALLIAGFIRDELSYDTFSDHADRVYRLATTFQNEGFDPEETASAPYAAGPALAEAVPQVRAFARLNPLSVTRWLVAHGDRRFYEVNIASADAAVFRVLGLRLLEGDAARALEQPNAVVLTAAMVEKYFGDEDPMGQTLTMGSEAYEVTGVMEDLPPNAHLHFDFLSSLASEAEWYAEMDARGRSWHLLGFYTYLLLDAGTDAQQVEAKLNEAAATIAEAKDQTFRLQPLRSIHLHSHLSGELEANGDIRYLYLFGTIALLVLLIAGVNYVNLTTARASRRAHEIGVRKVMGARRGQLMRQFLVEAVLVSTGAYVLGLVVAEVALPLFNQITHKSMAIDYGVEGIAFGALSIVLGLMAGLYPALVLARFRPAGVLGHHSGAARQRRAPLRKGLVVFQFAVTIALLVCTAGVQRQLDYVRASRLGFDKERLVVIRNGKQLGDQYDAFKETLLGDARFAAVTTSTNVPGQPVFNEYIWRKDKDDGEERFSLMYSTVDYDFVSTIGLALVDGRDFDPAMATDPQQAVLINEAMAAKMGWQEPVGQAFAGKRKVVGVVRDFLVTSSREEVEPSSYVLADGAQRFVAVRIQPGDLDAALERMRETWHAFVPEAPLDYSFVDTDVDAMYRSEQRLGRVFGAFSALAVVIACLGLFGLASFVAEQRTKEIGIRKVLGASAAGIVSLLSREFVALVLMAFGLATPPAYLFLERWLEGYVYRAEIAWWLFAAAGATALTVALFTIAPRAYRAATADPVQSLRYE